MSFASPELLLGLLLIPLGIAAYLWFQRRRSRYAVRFTNVALLSNLVPKSPAWRRHVPPALYLTAIGALVLALARPSMVMAIPREEATVILTMDVSGSMMATDVSPTRLAAAQQAAADFVNQLPAKFKIGLVAFSTAPRVVVSPTTDHQAILDALADLRPQGGTALGDAIETSLEAAGLDPQNPTGATPSPSATPDPSAVRPSGRPRRRRLIRPPRRRPTRRSSRSSRRCSCRTVPTRPVRPSRSMRPAMPRRSVCLSTPSRWARRTAE